MSEQFQREMRYIVTKIKTGKQVECVVVEHDWPEYEIVWKMIQDRMEGKPNELTALRSQVAELQRQLDEAAKQEPVGYLHVSPHHGGGMPKFHFKKDSHSDMYPVYERPINLPAIIEQAKAEEKKECAKLCDQADKSTHSADLADTIRARKP